MQAVRQEAVRRHCHHLTLHVWQGNDNARTFYEAQGLRPMYTAMECLL